jgi:uncharacterized small protein (DUF1192 family)
MSNNELEKKDVEIARLKAELKSNVAEDVDAMVDMSKEIMRLDGENASLREQLMWVVVLEGNNVDLGKTRELMQLEIGRLQDENEKLKEREAKWQAMCEESVGCSILADEFEGEAHEPGEFGRYIKNMEGQITALKEELERIKWAARANSRDKVSDILLHYDAELARQFPQSEKNIERIKEERLDAVNNVYRTTNDPNHTSN